MATQASPPAPAAIPGNLVSTASVAGRGGIDLARIQALSERASSMVEQVRSRLLAPETRKIAPTFSSAQLAALCGCDQAHIKYRIGKGDLPVGRLTPTGARREFTLAELRRWTREYRSAHMRPSGQRAITVTVGNFKGGVAKTTTAMVLAQGLSMRGHRVLVVDADAQGSLTTLHGVLPEAEVTEEMTIYPLCAGQVQDLSSAVRSTYWDGADLIASAPFVFGAEFLLPARLQQDRQARIWEVLNQGLEPLRDRYDVIVIDTPPTLSYVTLNALWAADGLIVPVPPSGLDFASAAQFWSLLSDLAADFDSRSTTGPKVFDFLHILLSRVDQTDVTVSAVRGWIQATYGEYMLPVEIPKTSVTSNKAAEFATIYDIQKYDGSAKTYKRAAEAYDRFVELVEESITATWRRRAGVA